MILKQVFFSAIICSAILSCSKKYPVLFERTEGEPKHPRGLTVSHDSLWAVSGHDGKFEILNQSTTIYKKEIPGMEDLRDIEILGDETVVLMNSGDLGRIWRYFPEKDSLGLAYSKDSVFLDGMAFWNTQFGIAFGDPVNGKLTILRTSDSSKTWQGLDYNLVPNGIPGEAGFAASGTGINVVGNGTVFIGTGGAKESRLFVSKDYGLNWDVLSTPMKSDTSYGIYSMYFWSDTEGVIIGGSYKYPEDKDSICFYTNDGGITWLERTEGLGGYSSCVHGAPNGDLLFATGRTGTFYSINKGENWLEFSEDKFYSVQISGNRVYFSGKNGSLKIVDITSLRSGIDDL